MSTESSYQVKVELIGTSFDSVMEVTFQITKRGALYHGEVLRIVQDMADNLSKMPMPTRWEIYGFGRMFGRYTAKGEEWEELEGPKKIELRAD